MRFLDSDAAPWRQAAVRPCTDGQRRHGAVALASRSAWSGVAIVGGGAIGVCCALELARRGARVTLSSAARARLRLFGGERGTDLPEPLDADLEPRLAPERPRWMWKRDSPFYLRPRPDVLPWLARFALAARHAGKGAAVIRELSNASLDLHAKLGEELDTSFDRTGTLNVYATPASLEAGAARGRALRAALRRARCRRDPRVRALADRPGRRLGSLPGRGAGRPESASSRWSAGQRPRPAPRSGRARRSDSLDELNAETSSSSRPARGAARSSTSRSRAGRATTSTTSPPRAIPHLPTWLQETWTIATPLPGRLRLSGTLELAGLDLGISQPRVDAIRRGGERWFRGLGGRPPIEPGQG